MISDKNPTIFDKYPVLHTVPSGKFPSHILIIPDGNGRWAQKDRKFVLCGHKKGADQILTITDDLSAIHDIKIITVWGFSADNWKRSVREVRGLFSLIRCQIKHTLKKLQQQNGRFVHLGRKDRIPSSLAKVIEHAESVTRNNTGQTICLAIDFGGADQELRVMQHARGIDSSTVMDEKMLWKLRDGHGLIPPADLLIRSSGEKRISDIGWLNGAPTELYFIDKLFPDVTTGDIVDAIVDFSRRGRRMGARV